VLKVKVEYVGHVKNIIGNKREEEVEVKDKALIADLLMVLSEKYGDAFERAVYEKSGADVKSNYIITVNGYLLNQLNGVQTRLKNGDHITILPIVSGG
jgi:MoaD family protein